MSVVVDASDEGTLSRMPNFSRMIRVPERSQSQTDRQEGLSPISRDEPNPQSDPLRAHQDVNRERKDRPSPLVFRDPWRRTAGLADGPSAADIDSTILHSFPIPPSPRFGSNSSILGSISERSDYTASTMPRPSDAASDGNLGHGTKRLDCATPEGCVAARDPVRSHSDFHLGARRSTNDSFNYSRPYVRSSSYAGTPETSGRQEQFPLEASKPRSLQHDAETTPMRLEKFG